MCVVCVYLVSILRLVSILWSLSILNCGQCLFCGQCPCASCPLCNQCPCFAQLSVCTSRSASTLCEFLLWCQCPLCSQCPSCGSFPIASSYTAQIPILSSLHFHFLADLFNRTPSPLFMEASSMEAAINAWSLLVHKYLPMSIARYSRSNVEWKKLLKVWHGCAGFKSSSFSWQSKALAIDHCATIMLCYFYVITVHLEVSVHLVVNNCIHNVWVSTLTLSAL